MRTITLAAVLCLTLPSAQAVAQTSQCQWIGNIWSCSQQPPQPGIRWDLLQQPDIAGNAMRAYEDGRRAREERERARAEAERIAAERDFYRAQTQAITQQGQRPAIPAPPAEDYSQRWLAAAQPRMHLFPDFAKVVFAKEVAISADMVKLMSTSPYAADIAYHLATHRIEARAIYDMQPLDAARAISRLEDEARLKDTSRASATAGH